MMEICLPGLVAFPFRARYDDAHKAATHSTGLTNSDAGSILPALG